MCSRSMAKTVGSIVVASAFLFFAGVDQSSSSAEAAGVSASPAPTARQATTAEQKIFQLFAPSPSGWTLDMYAVAGPYALVGFYNQFSGVTELFFNKNGVWQRAYKGGGDLTPDLYGNYLPNITLSTANSLYKLGRLQDK